MGKFNWLLMGTYPQEVLDRARDFVPGETPQGIEWADTPQGARFWHNFFTRGDKRGYLAVGRMLRQAKEDVHIQFSALYRFPAITPQPRTIVVNADWLRQARLSYLPLSLNWHKTPQGKNFWLLWFSSSLLERDPEPLEQLITAAKNYVKNERKRKHNPN